MNWQYRKTNKHNYKKLILKKFYYKKTYYKAIATIAKTKVAIINTYKIIIPATTI